ncbi:hypothetical protein EMCRGX_G021066 [Ephydatia muelleri]
MARLSTFPDASQEHLTLESPHCTGGCAVTPSEEWRDRKSIASHFPTSCISVLRTSAYPTSLKRMVNHLGDIKAHYRTLAVPMPSYAMAALPVFALAAGCSAWEAVNYCDGDGAPSS